MKRAGWPGHRFRRLVSVAASRRNETSRLLTKVRMLFVSPRKRSISTQKRGCFIAARDRKQLETRRVGTCPLHRCGVTTPTKSPRPFHLTTESQKRRLSL